MKRVGLSIAWILMACGCSSGPQGGGPVATPVVGGGTSAPVATTPGPLGTASVTGRCLLSGTAPVDKPINMSADPKCAAAHATPPVTDNFKINADGSVPNVLVFVKNAPAGSYDPPAEAAMLDQKGCMYLPKVLGLMAGQKLSIRNSDPTLHNVHALPSVNKEFNLGMPTAGMTVDKVFTTPEQMVKFKCDVHPWMFAYVGVMAHPFFGATGDAGAFTIGRLPAGKYTLEAWHNKYGTQSVEVEVAEGETKAVDITFAPPAGA